jgi:hypothetical protein
MAQAPDIDVVVLAAGSAAPRTGIRPLQARGRLSPEYG